MKSNLPSNRSHEPEADVFELTKYLPHLLAATSGRVSRLLSQQFAVAFALTIPEWRILAVVGTHGTLSPSAVGDLTAMDKVKVSRASASLVSRGMLKQSRDPKDGRGRLLQLTRKGASIYRGATPVARELETFLAEGLSKTEWNMLNKALLKLNAHIEQMSESDTDIELD